MTALIIAVSAVARDFTYQDVIYTVQDEDAKTCHTKSGSIAFMQPPEPGNTVGGELVIPAQVSDGNDIYTVVGLGDVAFYGCTSLTSINLPATVTRIGSSAFFGCTSLTSVDIPDAVTHIASSAFYGCTGLTSVDLPAGVTQIGSSAFYDCTGLTSVDLPAGVTQIGTYAFKNCTGLTSVEFSAALTHIEEGAFYGCSGLTSIDLPAGVNQIGIFAFQDCIGLQCVVIPSSVSQLCDGAFSGCTALTSAEIYAAEIGSRCFGWCLKLASVTLGRSVSKIGERAFEATPMTDLYSFNATPPAVHSQAFMSEYNTATLHVTAEAKEAYCNHEYWGQFYNIVTDISAGIEGVDADGLVGPERYYNLQGQPVDAARLQPNHIYIKRLGAKSSKILVE